MKDIPLDELARLTRRRSSKVEPEPVDVSGLLGAVPVLAFRCSHLMSHRDERDSTSRCWLTRRRSSNVEPSVDVPGFAGFDSDPERYGGRKCKQTVQYATIESTLASEEQLTCRRSSNDDPSSVGGSGPGRCCFVDFDASSSSSLFEGARFGFLGSLFIVSGRSPSTRRPAASLCEREAGEVQFSVAKMSHKTAADFAVCGPPRAPSGGAVKGHSGSRSQTRSDGAKKLKL